MIKELIKGLMQWAGLAKPASFEERTIKGYFPDAHCELVSVMQRGRPGVPDGKVNLYEIHIATDLVDGIWGTGDTAQDAWSDALERLVRTKRIVFAASAQDGGRTE